jgi:hypothetical protein
MITADYADLTQFRTRTLDFLLTSNNREAEATLQLSQRRALVVGFSVAVYQEVLSGAKKVLRRINADSTVDRFETFIKLAGDVELTKSWQDVFALEKLNDNNLFRGVELPDGDHKVSMRMIASSTNETDVQFPITVRLTLSMYEFPQPK